MKRVALVLICFVGLLAPLPSFAAPAIPPPAHCNAVSPTLPSAAAAAAPAPLPSWLAPQGAQPTSAPASNSIDVKLGFGITPCTIDFCDACGGCCRATSRGCACC